MPHLLVDVTAHGYGHLAQTAPVVNALARRVPDLRVTVRSAAPEEILRQRFQCEFRHISVALDFGMSMVNAVEVDVARSLAEYRAYHTNWADKVAQAAAAMAALEPDLLLANVPYLSLAAAQHAGIPAVAMCCLNWADLYRHYAIDAAECDAIHAQMLAAYNSASCFLKVQPTMPMPGLEYAKTIAPIAQMGCNRREEVAQLLALSQADKLVLVGMGGIEYALPMQNWPVQLDVHWIVPAAWGVQRADVTALDALAMPFSDVLASVDAVLTKPGYGMFAEAACTGIPVLYVPRVNWPEQPYLIDWLQQHGVCAAVDDTQLQRGDLAGALDSLWTQTKPQIPLGNGDEEAAAVLYELLCSGNKL
ncbi:MAG: glycosyltransferase family protein [Gallionella sp.]|nr:glycosyltransferase family protein [Gallionella sp.]